MSLLSALPMLLAFLSPLALLVVADRKFHRR